MKKLKYIGLILIAAFLATACEKNEIAFDSVPVNDMALVQLHNELPVVAGTANNFLKVELNGIDITYGNLVTLSSWNSIPTALGRYYETAPGSASIKLYQGTGMVLKYEQTVTLQTGKQGLILYDFDKPPLVVTEPDNYIPDRMSYDTDTIEYVRFFNLLHESPGVLSNLKLQYQYQYVINPLYTLADQAAGSIPPGSNVGDAVPAANQIRSAWLNAGGQLASGEDTGWQLIPVKKTGYVTQGTARVDYRVKVVQGGIEGVNMTAGDNLLICNNRAATSVINGFTDYWNGTIGRRFYHFFAGNRTGGEPGIAITQFVEK